MTRAELLRAFMRERALARDEAYDGPAPSAFPVGDHVGGTRGHFLQPSDEETRTWGNSAPLAFEATNAETSVLLPTPQLVHVHRRHPTSYSILTVVDLMSGWAGETGIFWQVTASAIVGVGQAQVNVKRLIPIPAAQIADGAQFIDLFEGVPAHAIQCAAVLSGQVSYAGPPIIRYVNITQLIAPLFA